MCAGVGRESPGVGQGRKVEEVGEEGVRAGDEGA